MSVVASSLVKQSLCCLCTHDCYGCVVFGIIDLLPDFSFESESLDLCVPCTCTRGSVTQVACQLRSISGLTACHLRVNCARTFWNRSFCGRQHVVGRNVDAHLYCASWMCTIACFFAYVSHVFCCWYVDTEQLTWRWGAVDTEMVRS